MAETLPTHLFPARWAWQTGSDVLIAEAAFVYPKSPQ